MSKKKNTKNAVEFPEPMSRNEAILQNMLGAENEILPPMSRIEVLLIQIKEMLASLATGYTGGDYITVDETTKTISTTLHAGSGVTIDNDGAINADSQLPAVTNTDDGKVLKVANGAWAKGEAGGDEIINYYIGIGVNMSDDTTVSDYRFFTPADENYNFLDIYNDIMAGKKVFITVEDAATTLQAGYNKGKTKIISYFAENGTTPNFVGIFNGIRSGSIVTRKLMLRAVASQYMNVNNKTIVIQNISTDFYSILQ